MCSKKILQDTQSPQLEAEVASNILNSILGAVVFYWLPLFLLFKKPVTNNPRLVTSYHFFKHNWSPISSIGYRLSLFQTKLVTNELDWLPLITISNKTGHQ